MNSYERRLSQQKNRAFGAGFACGAMWTLFIYLWVHSI